MDDDSPHGPQITMFGVARELGVHRVSAHTRILPDGTSSFVAEHLRWNRGRQPHGPSTPRLKTVAPDADQLALFPK